MNRNTPVPDVPERVLTADRINTVAGSVIDSGLFADLGFRAFRRGHRTSERGTREKLRCHLALNLPVMGRWDDSFYANR
jgi:hypothetical protein